MTIGTASSSGEESKVRRCRNETDAKHTTVNKSPRKAEEGNRDEVHTHFYFGHSVVCNRCRPYIDCRVAHSSQNRLEWATRKAATGK